MPCLTSYHVISAIACHYVSVVHVSRCFQATQQQELGDVHVEHASESPSAVGRWNCLKLSAAVRQCGCGLQHHCCCVGKRAPSLGRNGNLHSSKDLRHPKSRVFYATISARGCPGMAFRDVIELAVSIRVQLHFALGTCSVHPVDR